MRKTTFFFRCLSLAFCSALEKSIRFSWSENQAEQLQEDVHLANRIEPLTLAAYTSWSHHLFLVGIQKYALAWHVLVTIETSPVIVTSVWVMQGGAMLSTKP